MEKAPRAAAQEPRPVLIRIREGDLAVDGSWVYVWLSVVDRAVLYVGGTGLPPEVRTWVHLHSDDPGLGRLRVLYPACVTEPLDVLAFALPPGLRRDAARDALVELLAARGRLADRYVGSPPTGTVAQVDDGTRTWLNDILPTVVKHIDEHIAAVGGPTS